MAQISVNVNPPPPPPFMAPPFPYVSSAASSYFGTLCDTYSFLKNSPLTSWYIQRDAVGGESPHTGAESASPPPPSSFHRTGPVASMASAWAPHFTRCILYASYISWAGMLRSYFYGLSHLRYLKKKKTFKKILSHWHRFYRTQLIALSCSFFSFLLA